jgi:hypothetical protein
VNRACRAREVVEAAVPSTEGAEHTGFACIEAYLSRRRQSHPTTFASILISLSRKFVRDHIT